MFITSFKSSKNMHKLLDNHDYIPIILITFFEIPSDTVYIFVHCANALIPDGIKMSSSRFTVYLSAKICRM